ncbi:type VI secretion system baseplate subunit TssK [Pigmentiphaga sp. GD03639]|uniref:type VI secretion system baseplate subunit TssK n=1 Tax=Pigmentiphaga sp. GD03639 TaxID=2975354 RepID=UPI0024487070|nr:type VI secretion system baseplate subunit TssK [Pigmentiphaga sp. GD03639]MDH2239909.1 type VI secretion system baseplate subunit TssK [Pigmentiphaga sp. GD03639]
MLNRQQVFWGQGAFLAPQHLQCHEEWARAYGWALHGLHAPYPRGFEALELDEQALAGGVVRIARYALLTAEGRWVGGGSAGAPQPGNAQVPERSLLEMTVAGNDPISLYLVLARDPTVQGLAPEQKSLLPARHALRTEHVADPFDPQAPAVDVDFVDCQPRIVCSLDEHAEAVLGSAESCKFAEILPNGPGRFKLSQDYVPPLVSLDASSNLARWTRALRDLVVSRGQDFASAKRQRGIRAASTSAQEVMRVLMMQTFARYIPLLQEHVRLGMVPPWQLYQDLRRLVAEFSVFSEEIGYAGGMQSNPAETELPVYDHDDLRRCFKLAFARAETLIKALTVGAEVGITLAYDGRFHKADLPASLFASDKTRFYLAFESLVQGMELAQRLQRTGKIASSEEMPRLLQAALFGLKIDLLPVPPEELPQKTPNTTYFLIDTRHQFWQFIKDRRNISIFSDLPADETVIKLFPVGAEE